MPYDPLTQVAPVALVASQPVIIVVRQESPFRTLADLVTAAKAKPGSVTMASAGSGTVAHLAGELLARVPASSSSMFPIGAPRRP